MEIFKQSHDSDLYSITGVTEEQLAILYNIHFNYLLYLESIVKRTDAELIKDAPGNPKEVRAILQLQVNICKDYKDVYEKLIALSKDELN